MRVMYVASEATPFIKSGGLADVIGSLPKETAKKGIESIVVIPKYRDMKLADQIEYNIVHRIQDFNTAHRRSMVILKP